jgi:hypothetical protein
VEATRSAYCFLGDQFCVVAKMVIWSG